MAVSGKDKRGLVEELRILRTRLDRLERRNAELVHVQQELHGSLEQFKTVFDDSLVGLYRTTPDGRILMANSALVDMLGYSSFDELARRNLESEGYEPEYPRSQFKERIEREGKVIGLESAWKKSDGTTVYVRESAQAVRDESGHTLYYQGTVEDITARKQAEEALRKAHDELETRVKERTAELEQANDALQAEIASRKRAAEQLRESENRYRTVIEHAGEGIAVTQDGMSQLVNPQLLATTGYSKEEIVSRPFIEFVHPEDREKVLDIYAKRLEGKQVPPVYELRLIDKQGNIRWIENNGVTIQWNGKLASLNFLRDITARRHTEQALKEREEMIRALVETSRDWIWSIDINGVHTYCNPAVERILGYSADELVGKHSLHLIHDDDRKTVEAKMATWMAEKRGWTNLMLRWRHKDGTYRHLESNAVPILDSENSVIGFRGVDRDITDRERAEKALRESEARFRTTIESLPFDFFMIGADGRYVFQNSVVKENWGDVIGKRPEDVADSEDVRALWKENNRRAFSGETIEGEVSFSFKGEKRHYYNIISPIRGEDRIRGILGMNIDITEHRQAEKALKETTGLLETIFEHTHMLVAYLDAQFNFVRVNRAYARADGCELSFYPGKNHFDLFPNAENQEIFRMVVQTGVPYSTYAKPFEHPEHPERGVTYWDWSLVPIKQQDGSVSGLVLTLANVTERKQAEQALQESEERFRRMFELSPYATLLSDLDGRILACNQQFCEMHGTQAGPEAQVGRKVADFFSEQERPTLRSRMSKTVEERKSQGLHEYMMLREDGTAFPAEACSTIVADRNGTPQGMLAIAHDITERRQAEKALRESEATLISIFRAAPVGIGLECNRTLSRVNDQICAMLGYSRDELVGQRAGMFYPTEDDYERVRQENRRQIHETGAATLETRWKRKDGHIIDVLLNTTVLDPAEFSRGVTFTALDITGRKRAEESLRESEEKFRSLAEQSPNMIFINQQGRIVYANNKCEEAMGYTREQLCSADFDFLTLIAPESVDRIREYFARHARGEEVEPYDYSAITREGRRIEAINASKLIQYQGRTAILGVVTDITEHKNVERALRESEERLKILFESAPDAIYLIDSEGRFVDGNRASEELVGSPKAELIGKSLVESGLMRPEDAARAAENLRKAAAGEPAEPSDYVITRKDGAQVAIETRVFPVKIAGRTLCLGIARDTTARKRVEEALRASERKFRSIFETAANLITSVTAEGIIVDCNDRVREFLGYEKEEVLGHSMAKIIHPDSLSKAKGALREILSQGFSYNDEYKMVRKDRSVIDVSINSSAIDDENGTNTRTLCIIDNITERKQAQQRLLDDREQLKSLASQLSLTEERERHRLATELHDQIGQSLVISKIKLDQLHKSESSGAMKGALNEVSRCLAQVIAATRTLTFDLSYPILYELGFEAAVAEWLSEQIEEEHGIKSDFADDGQPKPLDDDIRAILFRNVRELLINVVKHAQADHVKVSVRRADQDICVCVEDNGVGFDSVEVAAMAAKRAEFGLLSIRERLEQLGGHIEIESEPGRGTKITMCAPLRREQLDDGAET